MVGDFGFWGGGDIIGKFFVFPCSSMVERSPVKRRVGGSSPPGGALLRISSIFFGFRLH